MKQNSLDVKNRATSSSSSSSFTDHHSENPFNGRGDSEIVKARREIRESGLRRESLLDDLCESIVDKKSAFSNSFTTSTTLTKVKKLELASSPGLFGDSPTHVPKKATNYSHFNGKPVNGKSNPLDQNTKTELLASLKHIDNGSFDN